MARASCPQRKAPRVGCRDAQGTPSPALPSGGSKPKPQAGTNYRNAEEGVCTCSWEAPAEELPIPRERVPWAGTGCQ